MSKGITCYERDEVLCDDPVCVRSGCMILHYDKLAKDQGADDFGDDDFVSPEKMEMEREK